MGRRGKEGDEEEAEWGGMGATDLNLITGPHAQFSRHKGSEWGPRVPGGSQPLQLLGKHEVQMTVCKQRG